MLIGSKMIVLDFNETSQLGDVLIKVKHDIFCVTAIKAQTIIHLLGIFLWICLSPHLNHEKSTLMS